MILLPTKIMSDYRETMTEITSIISRRLPLTAEYILTTNVKSPIKILGVAVAQIRDSKKDPWRHGYFCSYEDGGVTKKAEINEELYLALHLVFTSCADTPAFMPEIMPEV